MALLVLPMLAGQHKMHIWASKKLKLYKTKLYTYNMIFASFVNSNKLLLKLIYKSTKIL